MVAPDATPSNDATSMVIRLLKHQVTGLLVEGLIRYRHDEFGFLMETKADERIPLSGAGPLLQSLLKDRRFIDTFAASLVDRLASVFWVEMTEYLIQDTTCSFSGFGEFRRFSSKISFLSDHLWERTTLPSISSSESEYPFDALCRFVMEPTRAATKSAARSFTGTTDILRQLASDLLRGTLNFLNVLQAPANSVASVVSTTTALATYYAWIVAFDSAIQSRLLFLPEVGSFELIRGPVSRVDFSPDEALWKLISANAQKPPLPDEITPPSSAAA